MRKFFLLLFLVSMLVLPTSAQAQGNTKIGKLVVQLWPEYDHPDMLIMYSFSLAEDSVLPAEIDIRIPADAELNAVAKVENEAMINVPYDAPVKDGDWLVITIMVDDLTDYRVEYYKPINKSGDTRSFDFVWQNDYTVNSFFVQFQQPPSSNNFTSTPSLPNVNLGSGGITYHDLEMGGLAAGSDFSLNLSYDKPNNDLTVSSMPVEVGSNTVSETSEAPNSFSTDNFLPYILVGIGILLIAGGLLYFFSSGRQEPATKSRKRHSRSTAAAGGNIYCHECGSRASSSDKFCRACGAKLRR